MNLFTRNRTVAALLAAGVTLMVTVAQMRPAGENPQQPPHVAAPTSPAPQADGTTGATSPQYTVDFDKIEHWTGEGENRAALVVQFLGDENAYVWGYRWPKGEERNGVTMFKDIAADTYNLICFAQYTGQYGETLCGVGLSDGMSLLNSLYFDFDFAKNESGATFDYYSANTFMGQTEAPGDRTPDLCAAAISAAASTHVIQHPLDYGTYGYPAYDYDAWRVDTSSSSYNPDDRWNAGWYDGYWSYWTSPGNGQELSYSGVGYTGRILTDGCIDGWRYSDIAELGAGEAPDLSDATLVYMPANSDVYPYGYDINFGPGTEQGVITLTPKEMLGLRPVAVPADAALPTFTYELSGNGTDRDNYVATMYKVNYWDPTRIQFYELNGHREGTCTLRVTGSDGFVKEFTVNVVEPDRTPLGEDFYLDGTLMLNEEWFGHTNGGFNYYGADGSIIYQAYERENPGMSFGATSQHGTIWAGRLMVASKQAVDGGDPLPGGGRFVMADARTMKRIGSIDDLVWEDETKSADGRAVCGATPDKAYISSTNGVYVIDLNKVEIIGKITVGADGNTDLYNGQCGDMVNAGRYVFGVCQSRGVFVIDTETDEIVREIEESTIQGITQTADGTVWYATVKDGHARFVGLDPMTFEVRSEKEFDSTMGTVTCSWGAWRSTAFYGNYADNRIFFMTGASGIAGGGSGCWSWQEGDDEAKLICTVSNLDGVAIKKAATDDTPATYVKQKAYGAPRFDPRSGQLIVMTVENSASGHYRNSWTHWVDAATGEFVRTEYLRPYYWFQALPIFPDKYAAEFDETIPTGLNLDLGTEATEIELSGHVTDRDNIDANINFSVASADDIVECSIENGVLSIRPLRGGKTTVTVTAESNGRLSTREIAVEVAFPYDIHFGEGTEDGVITLTPKEMLGLRPVAVPLDAALPTFTYELSGNGTDRDNYVATMYKVNYWDPTRIQFYELNGHREGTCTLRVTGSDGFVKEFTVNVVEPDRTPLGEDFYLDGTLMLNEEWFGHTNGGFNYYGADGSIIYQAYERENPGMSFGATSQHGTIWAGRLMVASKQAVDGGDPLPGGGRFVMADARTMKRIGSIDDLVWEDETKSADGRAVCGATPDKAYISSTNGVYVIDLNKVEIIGKITVGADGNTDLYNGQCGDMVNAGRYVFGVCQSRGVFVIDTETDEIVREIEESTIQGITQTADGTVWYATVKDGHARFVGLDPMTFEVRSEKEFDSTMGTVTCSWGAWRSTAFYGNYADNRIFFMTGASGIAGGGSGCWSWQEGDDEAKLICTVSNLDGVAIKKAATDDTPATYVKQKAYGAPRFDPRSGQLIVMTVENSASGHYRNSWTHWVDAATGEFVRTEYLRPYYWFQALPIFPDKYAAEFDETLAEGVTMMDMDEPVDVNLASKVSDCDNIDANIALTVETSGSDIAEYEFDGQTLTVKPLKGGLDNVVVTAESNGVQSTFNLPVTVNVTVGVETTAAESSTIEPIGNRRVRFVGFSGERAGVYDTNGRLMIEFDVDDDDFVVALDLEPAVYMVRTDNKQLKFWLK
ncbi:MAG: DUF5074 domain-containing protein [Clostridium sp.]|nr:DUF5074 domain-containing protein [Clostridium sp.]